MKLIINKNYLIRCELYTKFGYGGKYDPYAARCVFRLPESAGLPEGYTVYIDAAVMWARDERNNVLRDDKENPVVVRYYELENESFYFEPSNNGYVAIMTEKREQGKRYKRYKYSAEELYSLYQNVNLNNATLVVACIDIYIDGETGNLHKFLYGNRIERTDYFIGKIQGSWFYCDELDTKRRIGSRGVKILGKINSSNEQEIRKNIYSLRLALAEHKKIYDDIFSIARTVDRVLLEFKSYKKSNDEAVNEAFTAIYNSATNAQQLIQDKLNNERLEQKKILTDFEESIGRFYKG